MDEGATCPAKAALDHWSEVEVIRHGRLEGFEVELRSYERCFQLKRLVFRE